MPVSEVLLLRHGHRLAWTLDPTTGRYTSNHPFPTKLPADPPLASHGVRQAEETGVYLEDHLAEAAQADRLRVYSSLFYRCLQTLQPTVERLRAHAQPALKVRGERGVGEWFGKAWFEQPTPAEPKRLQDEFYSWIDGEYESKVIPDRHGEKIQSLHDRIARALSAVVQDVDQEFDEAGRGEEHVVLLICGHAAQIIAAGRALTGMMPEDPDQEDFKCYTCGISTFVRRNRSTSSTSLTAKTNEDWRHGGGVAGGFDCVQNSWCGHLSEGEERGWHFHGDESFDSYAAASKLGIKTSIGSAQQTKETVEDSNEAPSKL